MRICALIMLTLLAPAISHAEIEKHAETCKKGICLYWWPKLPHLTGWHQDAGSSDLYGFNAQAPDGQTFNNADTVIYAQAEYKPDLPGVTSLASYIENDLARFRKETPSLTISPAPGVKTAAGSNLLLYHFIPANGGNWEAVAYGEEGDYFVVFTLSARTQQGYELTLPTFNMLIQEYR